MAALHDPRGRADAWGHDRSVDQVVFRWDTENLSGTTGFGPVACSCPPERADDLFRRTGALLRGTGEVTAPALLRLERADEVLLVRRAPWRDAGGRAGTLCHALLGPAAVLDPATCLGLHGWSWQGADLPLAEVRGRLPRVAEAPLVAAADEGLRALTAALPRVRYELTGAVAEFLRHPTASFTLLDPAGTAACPVLWGLHGVFGGQAVRGWTFATHDTDETDQLRFVFVSRWSGAAAAAGNRRRVDPAERCGDRAEAVAEALVRHQLREEYAVGRPCGASPPATAGCRCWRWQRRRCRCCGPPRRPRPRSRSRSAPCPRSGPPPPGTGRRWGACWAPPRAAGRAADPSGATCGPRSTTPSHRTPPRRCPGRPTTSCCGPCAWEPATRA
ncbi:hypothetical protein [Streptomyces sp. CC228A]|uniref:hypothetical protein n=1 Tax=Streptomyces sp. CC228A TaxID=2898186 RepID=UPI001F183436|nr:hypothetical protein [Streptomyces sp. CC228A]